MPSKNKFCRLGLFLAFGRRWSIRFRGRPYQVYIRQQPRVLLWASIAPRLSLRNSHHTANKCRSTAQFCSNSRGASSCGVKPPFYWIGSSPCGSISPPMGLMPSAGGTQRMTCSTKCLQAHSTGMPLAAVGKGCAIYAVDERPCAMPVNHVFVCKRPL